MAEHKSSGRCCIIDEFGPYQLALNWFNKLGDGNELSVPIKGGFVQWNCEVLFITSNHEPAAIYPQFNSDGNGKMVRSGFPEPSFYSRVDEHHRFSYSIGHEPTAVFDNRVECASFAVCVSVKG